MKSELSTKENKRKIPSGQIIATIIIAVILMIAALCANDESFKARSLAIIVILAIGNLVLIWVPNVLNESINIWFGRIMFVLTPIFTFFIVERFNYINIWDINTLRFELNILIISFILLLVYFITNNTRIASVITIIVLYLAALVNFYIFSFRDVPIIAADIASMGTAANVASNYSYQPNSRVLINGLIVFAFIVIFCRLKIKTGLVWKKRFAGILVYFVLLGIFTGIFYETDVIDNAGVRVSVWNPQKSYNVNGFILSFMVTTKYIKIDKPEGYSLEAVDDIISPYMEEANTTSATPNVNVIAIMDEAFTDLKLDGDFETSEDYMPFIRSLSENTVKGTLSMSVFGGNTANSEFEFLTGNSLAFLPTRSVPYQLYIKSPLASLTYTLEDQGYAGNMAIHPYKGDGWARNTTYPLLGFKDFITMDQFENPNLIRKYITDEESFNKIIEEYKTTRTQTEAPFYAFNVTMQNHGGYDTDFDNLERTIKILGDAADDQAERYINLVKKTDEAFEGLVNYFSQVDEPTVIVFFGDHQPSVHTQFYNKIMGKSADNLTSEEAMTKYQVPFVIWANYDIEEKQYDKLSANYLSSVLLDTIGAKSTGYNRFLLDVSEQVPVITANGYYGADGNFYELGEESPYTEILNQYNILEYNNMFDKSNRRNDFFYLEDVDR
ncbi:MAG: LTA synthase family protein [Lachnotalea sp.]